MIDDCEHRWTPQGNGISICELCHGAVFSSGDLLQEDWPVGLDDLNTLSFGAFRYALGRTTYVVDMTCKSLIRNAKHIRRDIRGAISREINTAILLDNAGMECDIIEWRKVLEAFK